MAILRHRDDRSGTQLYTDTAPVHRHMACAIAVLLLALCGAQAAGSLPLGTRLLASISAVMTHTSRESCKAGFVVFQYPAYKRAAFWGAAGAVGQAPIMSFSCQYAVSRVRLPQAASLRMTMSNLSKSRLQYHFWRNARCLMATCQQ